MDGISNSINDDGVNFSLLKSGITVHKATPKAITPDGQPVGNILDSFGGLLKQQMTSINNLQNEANQAKETYAVGGDIPLHTVMIAGEKADLALQLAMQVRNKLVAAYQEISHMSI